MDCEIVVRFAGTLLDVIRVSHGGGFRIGTARDVDLPVDIAPLSSFPLVDSTPNGFVVRCPAGVPAVEYTADLAITVTESEIKLAPGSRIDLAFGRVMLSIALAPKLPRLAKPAMQKRPHVFAAVSLVAHLVVVLVAFMRADIDPITVPVVRLSPDALLPVHIARFPSETQKAQHRRPKKLRTATAAAPAATVEPVPGGPREQAIHDARGAGILGADFSGIKKLIGTVNIAKALEDVGPIYDEDAANAKLFGGSAGAFDPTKDPKFASVQTGRYATVAVGKEAGDYYDIGGASRAGVSVAMCESTTCIAEGGIDRDIVRGQFEARVKDLVKCYELHAPRTDHGKVMLTFEIDPEGRADHVRMSGLSRVGNCVAGVAKNLQFPSGTTATKVKYPLVFTRS